MLNTAEKLSKFLTETVTLVSSVHIMCSLRHLYFKKSIYVNYINKGPRIDLGKSPCFIFPQVWGKKKVWATLEHFISKVSEPICSCSLNVTKCNLASMIYTVKMLSQVTENSSNTHILFDRFEYTVCHLKGSIFSTHPFPEANLFCDQHFINM